MIVNKKNLIIGLSSKTNNLLSDNFINIYEKKSNKSKKILIKNFKNFIRQRRFSLNF